MTRRQLERALRDESIFDKEFFAMLLKYCNEQDVKMQKSKKSVSLHSQDFKKQRMALAGFRSLIQVFRPAVHDMAWKHILGVHEECCGPKSEK